MTSLRYDPAHKPHGFSARAAVKNQDRSCRWGEPGMLSIVVPASNEAENLPVLIEEILRAFQPLVASTSVRPRMSAFEILVVDDGSTDETETVLERLALLHPEVRPIHLIRNVGQSAATAAGFREALGEWVGLLDADLQNHPADLAMLWGLLPGHDAALGWRRTRMDKWSKRVASRWANVVRNMVLGQAIRDTGCSVRILRREMALRLPTFKGFHRFLGPLLLREGCRIVQAPVSHRARAHGQSHYHFWNRSYQVVMDLLGVAWLMRRAVRYELAESGVPYEPASRVPSPHLARAHFLELAENQQEAA